MKLFILTAFVVPMFASAQVVNTQDIPADSEETTTIHVKKTSKAPEATATSTNPKQVVDGEADISGEPQAMSKEARESWLKACNDWKKEFRADNKKNDIINLNCGQPQCGGEAAKKTCTSKASYKIKTSTN